MEYMTTYQPSLDPSSPTVLWILILAFIIAFFLAFGVGANDVANSFGTSVGSKVLTLRQACILATIFEIAGAMTLGYKVSATIRTGMIDTKMFAGEEKLLMVGYLSSLIGGAIWNLLATFGGFPVSGTHSIVGAIVGFSIVAKGFKSVQWIAIAKIVASWFISPVLSGLVSVLLYLLIRLWILNKEKPLESGLLALPVFYAFVIIVNTFSIIHEGPYFFSYFEWWMALLMALGLGALTAVIVWFFVVPRQRTTIQSKLDNPSPKLIKKESEIEDKPKNNNSEPTEMIELNQNNTENHKNGKNVQKIESKDVENGIITSVISPSYEESADDKEEVSHLFTFLQILTACFGAFAHGGNDVSNAIGPLVAILLIYIEGDYRQTGDTPWFVLLYGGIGISIGLWIWGRRVIKTMGNDLTKITPSSGFTIEIGSALTVLLASKVGLPISTTHCKVGSVVMVGRVRHKEGVNWKLFRNIAIAWVLTVPLTALCSGGAMALLRLAV